MQEFFGTYRGFSPTDESPIAMGELEITLDEAGLHCRFATGLEVRKESLAATEFISMTEDEVRREYQDGSAFPQRTVGYRAKGGLPKLLFLRDPQDNFGLVMRVGEMSEMLGPTLLYSPVQIASCAFSQLIDNIEKVHGKNVFPRLANDGKA